MRIFFGLLLVCFSSTSFGQEKPSFRVDWAKLNVQLSENDYRYTLEHKEITPSLSYLHQKIITGSFYLMEIDLTVDLRNQHLKNKTPILLLPENRFIQSDYSVAIPTTERNSARITITGNGGYNSSSSNSGGIKNNAYRDASTYTGIYCPVTGLRLD